MPVTIRRFFHAVGKPRLIVAGALIAVAGLALPAVAAGPKPVLPNGDPAPRPDLAVSSPAANESIGFLRAPLSFSVKVTNLPGKHGDSANSPAAQIVFKKTADVDFVQPLSNFVPASPPGQAPLNCKTEGTDSVVCDIPPLKPGNVQYYDPAFELKRNPKGSAPVHVTIRNVVPADRDPSNNQLDLSITKSR